MSRECEQRVNIEFPWGPLVALYSAITYFMLGIDMALLHLGFQHFHFMAVMPVVFCFFAAFISFLTTFSRRLRHMAWVTGVLAMLVGLVGTVIHLEIAFSSFKEFSVREILRLLIFDPRPPLAPAALAGTGLLMIFVTLAERWPIPALHAWLYRAGHRFPWVQRMLIVHNAEDQADELAKK